MADSQPTAPNPSAAIPLHPTWPGWENDNATIRRGNALLKTYATSRDEAEAAAAWDALLALMPAYNAAEARMKAALACSSKKAR